MKIAFLSRVSHPFSPQTLETSGLGGTQNALVHLARELATLGHEISVFCRTGGQAGVHDGVSYRELHELPVWAKSADLDAFIAVADEEALRLHVPAHLTIWWGHNDYAHLWGGEMPDIAANISELLATKADKLITVSQWQTQQLAEVFKIPREHFWVSRNGVHWPFFEQERDRRANRLIYTSVPDRGLDVLLACFPSIRAQIPEAELHIFSGFDLWGKDPAWIEAREAPLRQAAQQSGVVWHGTVPPHILAGELLQSDLFVYPNHASPDTLFFAETSCISALEAQAAGLPAISSLRGALSETIREAETGLLIDGDPYSGDYQARFVEAVVRLLSDRASRDRLGNAARDRIRDHYTWPQIAREWSDQLQVWLRGESPSRLTSSPLTSPFPTPQISVIMPTYNRARNLAIALEGLCAQTFPAFEVLICDDGSTDDTPAIVESFRSRLNLRYLRQEDAGFRAAAARNMGIRQARGKLFVFMDSDILPPPDFLASHWRLHQSNNRLAVNHFVYRMTEDADDLSLPWDAFFERHQAILNPDSREKFNLFDRGVVEEGYFLDSNALSVKAKDLLNLGGFDENFVGWGHEDTELGYRLGHENFQFLFVRGDRPCYHLWHPVTPDKENEQKANWARLRQKYGIENYYVPLEKLEVYGPVFKRDAANEHEWLEGAYLLEVGKPMPPLACLCIVDTSEGVVSGMEEMS